MVAPLTREFFLMVVRFVLKTKFLEGAPPTASPHRRRGYPECSLGPSALQRVGRSPRHTLCISSTPTCRPRPPPTRRSGGAPGGRRRARRVARALPLTQPLYC